MSAPALERPQSYEIPWQDHDDGALTSILSLVAEHPALVSPEQIEALTATLDGPHSPLVLQAGDCVEGFDEATRLRTRRKAAFLARLGDRLSRNGKPVVTVGRMAGQFAKPRSAPTELVAGAEQLTYRGPLVHAWADRRVNVHRISTAVLAAAQVSSELEDLARHAPRVWTSHEVLLTEYEHRWVRETSVGSYLTSAHWPWIGNRTRALDGPHVALLAQVRNPVSVKVDATLSPQEAVELLRTLRGRYPDRHITFIARFGATKIEALGPLARGIARLGESPRWVIDPLHGNTVSTPFGKTRPLDAVLRETTRAVRILAEFGVVAGGLHLEATDLCVYECVDGSADPGAADLAGTRAPRLLSLCDPRLNEEQATRVVDAFAEEL
ncbi:phospho-2-dehydro-3-deoxyheptonate aldolase [Nocardia sp. SYP-A9097]|uniref:3-deoxy-7-phosphoheptulonate synthase n=1 Tax=Nocardia sp. SYP-A9097 TaxID=2663237 RepID=UPI00129A1590|nr:3-deoxy-7-phosphoheptulonate synthase [Nocardia sp. SYP-A9097]MRH89633.1 phospho-2-dehydro-3-deoxyheptonate aldolase [Nocardia sp. SYP-A9097]